MPDFVSLFQLAWQYGVIDIFLSNFERFVFVISFHEVADIVCFICIVSNAPFGIFLYAFLYMLDGYSVIVPNNCRTVFRYDAYVSLLGFLALHLSGQFVLFHKGIISWDVSLRNLGMAQRANKQQIPHCMVVWVFVKVMNFKVPHIIALAERATRMNLALKFCLHF